MTTIYRAVLRRGAYVGKTDRGFSARKAAHLKAARLGRNDCPAFYRALRGNDLQAEWEEVARVHPMFGGMLETIAIRRFGTLAPSGYNISRGGDGVGHTSETRSKISESMSGRGKSESHRRALSLSLKGRVGRTLSAATREKLSVAQTGKKRSAATRAKIGAAQKGIRRKPRSPETRAKISAALSGKPGRPHSAETRRRMSESHKRRRNGASA